MIITLDKSKLTCGTPNPDLFKLIQGRLPNLEQPVTPEDFIIVPVVASTNLLHETLAKWDIPSLEVMAASFPGCDLLLNHEWDEIEENVGFIADAELWEVANPSPQLLEYLLADSPNPDIDRQIIQKEGYYQLVAYFAIESNYEEATEVRYGRRYDVSIGGMSIADFICPICECSFMEDRCPHYMPTDSIGQMITRDEMNLIAPYYIRGQFTDAVEISFVVEGNCPQASIISKDMLNLL